MFTNTEKLNIRKIAVELGISAGQVESTVVLLDEGATIPFISRYRKEMTGSLDEVQVAQVRDRMDALRTLEKRRVFILETIEGQGKMTEELRNNILKADSLIQLEDLYLP
ncbi:MAG TPA: Tex-like N-terminal domain-containing protein, partial [Bacteroidia bacterium]|nr:Tex-like N-terminal domain-containing protein [Bacteroidia bacterium]